MKEKEIVKVDKKQGIEHKSFLKNRYFDEKYANDYDKWSENKEMRYVEERQKECFLELTGPKKIERVLDIGCGTGKYIMLYLNKSDFVVGIDISPKMLNKLTVKLNKMELGQKKIFLISGDGENLPIKDQVFNEVLTMNTLQYLPDDRRFIREIRRVLKDNGGVIIDGLSLVELRMGASITVIRDAVRKVFSKPPLSTYKQYYFPGKFRKLIEEEGFIVERKIGCIFRLPWFTREHLGITLPSPHHIILFVPGMFGFRRWIEDRIRRISPLNDLCTHILIKARKPKKI